MATQKKIVLTAEDRTKGAFRSAQRNMGKLESATAGLQKAFAVLAGAYGLQLVARSFINAADKATQLENKLQLVTHGTKDLTRVYGKLFQVSKDTRVSFEATSELYARLARSSDHLGLSEEQLFQITTSLNQAFAVSGAGIMETSSAVRQLGQGLASGRLAGDELRSIMENAPRVAKMIADGMGTTIGQLRKLGGEGKLNAESVTKAILKMGYEVKAEFNKTSGTIAQATTAMSDSWMNFVNVFDESTGTSGVITLGLERMSRGLDFFARKFSGKDPFDLYGDSLEELREKLKQAKEDRAAWHESKIWQGLFPEAGVQLFDKILAIDEKISKKTGQWKDFSDALAGEMPATIWVEELDEAGNSMDAYNEDLALMKSNYLDLADAIEVGTKIFGKSQDKLQGLKKAIGAIQGQTFMGFGYQDENTDRENLREQWKSNMTIIQEAYAEGIVDHQEYLNLKYQAEQDYAYRVDQLYAQSASNYTGQLAGMASATKDMSVEAFELWKALAIAQATINAYLTYTKVLQDPLIPTPVAHGIGVTMMGLSLAYASKISSMSYPGKEKGGNVIGGKSYIVGERGPEVFTPGSTGGITPNNKLGGTTNVNFQVTAVDTRNFDVLLQSRRGLIVSMINQAMNRAGRQGLI